MTEPAWLVSLIDQRMALIEDKLGDSVPDTNLIMTPLTEPERQGKTAYDHWDRSCDCCRTYCKPGTDYFTGHAVRQLKCGTQVFMHFGVCRQCASTLE